MPRTASPPGVAVVVNGDSTQLGTWCALVRQAGLEPMPFAAAEAVLTTLQTGTPPALIVIDLHLPGLDGWRFCRLLRSPEYAFGNEVPILVVSAVLAGEYPERIAAEAGADAFLPSPVDGKEFLAHVQALLQGRQPYRRSSVLIVRDDPDFAAALVDAFVARGYRADTASTASEALEAFGQRTYELAVLQYPLPDGAGDALLDAFRARRPDCVCVVLSKDVTPDLALDWMQRGASAYAREPLEPDGLVELCTRARRERALVRAEELLEARAREPRESEERYRSLIEHSPDAIAIYQDYKLVFVNPAIVRMLGAESAGELLGMSGGDVVHPEDRPAALERVGRLLAGEAGVYPAEVRYLRRDGSVVWGEVIGLRVQFAGRPALQFVVRDITDRKEAERRLRESEERHRNLFLAMQEGFALHEVICDAAGRPSDYRYLEVNPAFERATGIPRERWIGHTVREVLPNVEDYWIQGFGAVALTGKPATFENYVRELDKHYEVVAYSPKRGQFAVITLDVTERRRMEQALRRNEEWLRETARIARVGGWAIDLPDNTLSWTEETFQIHELDPARTPNVGEAIQFYHPDDRPKVAEAVRQAIADGRSYDFEARLFTARKNLVWIRSMGAAVYHEGRPVGVRGMIQDITERKRAEQALRASEERFRGILQNVATVAVQGYAADGTVRYWNRASETFYGYTAAEALGRNLLELIIPPAMRDEVRATIRRMAATGQPAPAAELALLRKDGSLISVYSSHALVTVPGQEVELFCIDIDLSARQQAEEALRGSEALYHDLVETSQDLIWQCDDQGRYIYLNPAWEQAFGYRLHEMLGRPFTDFQSPEQARRDRGLFGRLLTGGSVRGYETIHLRKDGSEIHLVFNAKVVYTPSKEVAGTRGTAFDITERRRAEEEKEKLQAQLTQAQKMESVGRLAGGVAHDFNNMLQAILGNTALALEDLPPESPARECLREVSKCAQRSADLTRQLLAFARKQTIAPKALDLNETVEGMLKMLRRLIGEHIELTWLPGAGLGCVHMDPSQVNQLLANLCVNARDAIGGGVGRVTIQTENARFDEAYVADHPEARAGDYVRLAVSDNGCGMSPEAQEHLFEPFFTTKAVGQGTGLGLATVYGIVRQNHGFISVRSEPARGTTFQLHLPRHLPRATPPAASASDVAPSGGKETILLVEDEPSILRVSQRLLKNLGYRVLAARTPGEALLLARENAGEIHLLMTDVVMPEMNGRDLARNLLSQYPKLKRLFMSGYTADVIAHHGVLDAGVHFIQKPFSLQALATKVRETLEEGT